MSAVALARRARSIRRRLLICIAARKLGRSLKWTADRLEDVSSCSQAFAEIVDAEMGFDANGVAAVLQADVIGDVGAYSIYPWTCGLEPVQVVSFLPGPYKIASYRGAVRGVATCKPPTGPYRGVGRPISTFVTERLMDLGARALGLDPLDIRRRNLVQPEEFPYRIASGIIWDKTGFVECLEAAAEAAGYEQLRAEQADARKRGRLFGVGIATYAELTGIGSRIAVAPGMPINTGSETAKITIDFDRRHHRGLWCRFPWAGAGDHAGPDRRRRSRREVRGYPHHPGRQRRGADVDRHLCEPQRSARRRRGQACVVSAAGQDQACRLASLGSQSGRYRCS